MKKTHIMLSLKAGPIKKEIQEQLSKQIVDILGGSHEVSEALRSGPHLAVVLVGDSSRSKVYIEQKKKFAEAIGAKLTLFEYPDTISPQELEASIKSVAADRAVHGIILQLPLPEYFSKEDMERALDSIPHIKDIDGLTTLNAGYLLKESTHAIIPATTRGIVEMLRYYNIEIKGKHVVIIGRSHLVGKPTAITMLANNATVTICHKETKNLAEVASTADILISATGIPNLIKKEFTKEGQVIIDVGIFVNESGQIQGDIDSSFLGSLSESGLHADPDHGIFAVSPVPGGVGPLTVAGLFLNLVDQYKKQVM